MKSYNVEEIQGETIIWYETDNRRISFGTNPSNSDYAEYLRYTTWVDEGKNPEDFWAQEEVL